MGQRFPWEPERPSVQVLKVLSRPRADAVQSADEFAGQITAARGAYTEAYIAILYGASQLGKRVIADAEVVLTGHEQVGCYAFDPRMFDREDAIPAGIRRRRSNVKYVNFRRRDIFTVDR